MPHGLANVLRVFFMLKFHEWTTAAGGWTKFFRNSTLDCNILPFS